MTGVVESVDVDAMKLVIKKSGKKAEPEEIVVGTAAIKKGGKDATLAEIAVGDHVNIKMDCSGEEPVVTSVEVKGAKAKKATKKSTKKGGKE